MLKLFKDYNSVGMTGVCDGSSSESGLKRYKKMLDNGDFASLGFDQAIGSNFIFGYGKDFSELSGNLGFAEGDGSVSGIKHFIYGSYSLDDYYMDAALFYGNEEYSHSRSVTPGSINSSFASEHDSLVIPGCLPSSLSILL